MQADLTRMEFLAALGGAALLPEPLAATPRAGRLLIVVAHPDDEYACAGATYRLVRELGWTADQLVITSGEGGYRYSTLAAAVYGKALAPANLPAVRKGETLRAGRILGISEHIFLDQHDFGFVSDPATANAGYWDRDKIAASLRVVLSKGGYDVLFTLLPTADTHTHHRDAAQIALDAVAALPEDRRPLVLGAEARARAGEPLRYGGAPPLLEFDRTASFGYRDALDYQIVVNWLIAEYKSQGLFQKDCGKHDVEQFWQLGPTAPRTVRVLDELRAGLQRR